MTARIEKDTNALGGAVTRHWFDNGYGASVLRGAPACGGLEIAVIHEDSGLVYDTPVTDDVIGYLNESDIDPILRQIEALPPRN